MIPEPTGRVEAATGGGAALAVSVEALAWGVLIVAAAGIRLASLGRLSLTLAEAGRALDASRVANGETPETWRGDLAAAVMSYLFRIFGDSEFVARLVPASAGVALVAVLWFARPHIGRVGALTAAVFVGFSPLFVIFARSATAFSVGSLLGAVMAISLFGYLRESRPGLMFPLVVSIALAPLTDAVAVTAALAVVAYLAIEVGLRGDQEIGRAWDAFRGSPLQFVSALLVLAAAFQLGLTHFGTTLERPWLPGLREWTEMFDTPRDSRAPEYHMALLLAYEWPLLLAGSAAFAVLALRFLRGGAATLSPFRRFLLVWTAVAALTLTLTTQREAGQLLIMLLPLALLAGSLTEEAASAIDWGVLRRWWPALLVALLLIGYVALLMTQWSSGSAGQSERVLMVAGVVVAVLSLVVPVRVLGSKGGATALSAVAALALAFTAHTSLAVAFENGTEFATDERLLGRTEQLRETLDVLAEQREGTIMIDGSLIEELGWTLRESPVVFGDPVEGSAAVVVPVGAAPAGFAPLGESWRVAEGWYPESLLRPRSLWRWLLFREPYYGLQAVEVQIYVPTV